MYIIKFTLSERAPGGTTSYVGPFPTKSRAEAYALECKASAPYVYVSHEVLPVIIPHRVVRHIDYH